MSRWADQFENHVIHETLRQTREWVNKDIENIDSEHEVEKRRLLKILDGLHEVLRGMDREFYPEAQLTSLNNSLHHAHFWGQLSTYSSSGQLQNLKLANNHINSQIVVIYQLAGMSRQPEASNAIRGVEEAYETFAKAVEKSKKEFQKVAHKKAAELTDLKAKTDALDQSLASLKSATDTQIATWQKEFTEAQTSRIEEHSQSQISRNKDYEAALEQFRTTTDSDRAETTKKHDTEFKNAFDTYVQDVNEKTGDIETKHKEILKLHGLVTTDGVAGGYKKGADGEWWSATIWSGISMLCYAIILGWVLFKGKLGFGIATPKTAVSVGVPDSANSAETTSITETVGVAFSSGIDWPLIATTISITAVALVAAQFAGRQSRLHRMNEQRLRWFSFEIAAIDPFISTLKPDQQLEIKRQLTEKLFGQDRVIEDRSKVTKGVDAETLKNITEALKSLRQE